MKPSPCLIAVGVASVLLACAGHAMAGPEQDSNKTVVLDFYKALDALFAKGMSKEGARAVAEQYLTLDYDQHSVLAKQIGHGREDFVSEMSDIPAQPPAGGSQMPPVLPPPTVLAVMAEGDEVILVTERTMALPSTSEPKPTIVFNMFRLRAGKLAEHWDAFGVLPESSPHN